MRAIDADALKRKYENRKRLFCRNRIEFSTLSDKDKARVDELDNCIADILNAPTIEPERKTGRWTHAWGTDDAIWKCSECGFEIDAHGCVDPVEYLETYKFCPNCGSDNREDIPMEYFENGGT